MSTASAQAAPAPAAGGKKKLLVIILAAVLVLVLGGGGAAFMLMKKKPAEGEDEEDAPPVAAATAKRPAGVAPTFVPLEMFTVNLADRDAERYAQIGITLEISDPKLDAQIKAYMPAIRNRILMAIADRTAAQLVTREGKEQLAQKVRREAAAALGFEVPDDDEAQAEPAAGDGAKKKHRKAPPPLPIDAVHFSNFIVQ